MNRCHKNYKSIGRKNEARDYIEKFLDMPSTGDIDKFIRNLCK